MSLDLFANDLVQDVTASAEADSVSTHDAFVERVLSDLESAGHIEDWFVAYYKQHGLELSGYGVNEALNSLDLFIGQFRQQPLAVKVGKSDLAAMAKRAINFAIKAREGLGDQIEDAVEAHDMASAVKEALKSATLIRVFILTNDVSTVHALDPIASSLSQRVVFEIWDLKRLNRLATSGVLHEPIVVDFDEPLPCLSTPTTDKNYSVFLAIIRGDALAKIYSEYGTRLLELNVRSFLQLKGGVNRGIRETLIHSPERFLAYNNGISATASKIDLVHHHDGSIAIKRIQDLQVVNGGQTTASIHSSFLKNEADLTQVFVQVKLTVVTPEHLNEIVPEISRFSNTQNKVTVVDFSSNDPYHVELEKITRTLWAPAAQGSGQETKWFFERARGQYSDEMNRAGTPAKQRAFKVMYPTKQKFLKTDVAKWENSWVQKPWIVCRGAEKNFRAFMAEQDGKAPTSDADYVRRLLAKGILFREAERVVTAQNFGGYRANIVAYTIAKLSNATSQRVDLERIWRDQALSDALVDALVDICHLAHKVIISPPTGTTHVGEWTKKELCWGRLVEVAWAASPKLEKELVSSRKAVKVSRSDGEARASVEEAAAIARVAAFGAQAWFDLSSWARETSNLAPWQRSLAYSLGRVAARGNDPSVRQAVQGVKILDEATRLGFHP